MDLTPLAELLAAMQRHARGHDAEALLQADVAFHKHICTLAGNRVLLRLWASLGPHAWTLFSVAQLRGYTLEALAERHRPIIEALRTGDPMQAERAATEHTLELARNIVDHLDALQPGSVALPRQETVAPR